MDRSNTSQNASTHSRGKHEINEAQADVRIEQGYHRNLIRMAGQERAADDAMEFCTDDRWIRDASIIKRWLERREDNAEADNDCAVPEVSWPIMSKLRREREWQRR